MSTSSNERHLRWLRVIKFPKTGPLTRRAAISHLVKDTTRWIYSRIHAHRSEAVKRGLFFTAEDVEDTHNEAVILLIERAIPKFEETHRVSWTTYAGWWVRAAFDRQFRRLRTVTIPANLTSDLDKRRRLLARDPKNYTTAHRQAVARSLGQVLSLDAPAHEDGTTAHNFFADPSPSAEDQLTAMDAADAITQLREALGELTPRQRKVIEGRMNGRTLRGLGGRLKMSAEGVRQSEKSALKLLRQALKRRGIEP